MDAPFPYTQSYKKLPVFFQAIQTAAVPSKFSNKFLVETLEFKGTNDRPFVSILRHLNFINTDGTPTENYSNYKNKDNARNILGQCIKSCYSVLYQKNESFEKLSDEKIRGFFESTTGKESKDRVLDNMVRTFLQLKNLADFDDVTHKVEELPLSQNATSLTSDPKSKDFVLSHTIVLNLPVSTDQKVYDVLFKSIKENLL